MARQFKTIEFDDRKTIASMYANGAIAGEIAQKIGVSRTTVYTELKRGQDGVTLDKNFRPAYDPELAQKRVQEGFRRRGRKKEGNAKVTLRALKDALGVQSASINVTTCAGAAATCSKGTETMTGVGSTKFSLPDSTGVWTVTAVLAGVTVTAEVEVSGALQYNVDLMITSSVAVTHAPHQNQL